MRGTFRARMRHCVFSLACKSCLDTQSEILNEHTQWRNKLESAVEWADAVKKEKVGRREKELSFRGWLDQAFMGAEEQTL